MYRSHAILMRTLKTKMLDLRYVGDISTIIGHTGESGVKQM